MSTQQHMAIIERLTRERDEARAEAARLSERLRAFTEWASTWRHAMVIRAIGADEAWRQFEEAHNGGCAALASTSATDWLRERLEAQREACAREVFAKSQCATASELGEISSHVRATPLVGLEPSTTTEEALDYWNKSCERERMTARDAIAKAEGKP